MKKDIKMQKELDKERVISMKSLFNLIHSKYLNVSFIKKLLEYTFTIQFQILLYNSLLMIITLMSLSDFLVF